MNAPLRAQDRAAWLTQGERGALAGIRAVFVIAKFFGRGPARRLVGLIALFYAATDGIARRASRDFLQRVHGRPVGFVEVYRHVRCFARVTLDRLFLLMGETSAFSVRRTGHHHLQRLTEARSGAMLLGAHVGSFEAMRVGAKSERIPIHIVGQFQNARMINTLLEQLDPELAARVLHVGDDPLDFALGVRERLDRGEMIAILADRVGGRDRQVVVDFLGGKAAFPAGPFLIASLLKCPVYLVFGLYFEPNRYELFCEPFAERVELPRQARASALQEVVQRYALALEGYVRRAPDNWFNFHDFWSNHTA